MPTKWHKNLHFTITTESNKSISFLDVLVARDEHQLITSLYRKPSHTGLYLLWDSSQNRKYKVGLIRTLVLRIYRICSKKEMVEKKLNELKNTLQMNGYPSHIVNRGISERELIYRKQSKTETKEIKKGKRTIYFTITYNGQESLVFASRIRRICNKLLPNVNIQFALRGNLSLKIIFLPILKGKDEQKTMKKPV